MLKHRANVGKRNEEAVPCVSSGFVVDLLYVRQGGKKPLSPFTFPTYLILSLEVCPHLRKTVFLPSSLWGGYSTIGIWGCKKINGDCTGRVWGCTQRRRVSEAGCGGEGKQESPE